MVNTTVFTRGALQTEVNSITWDESAKIWVTKTNRGDTIKSQFIVPAAGPLLPPQLPGLPIENFKGPPSIPHVGTTTIPRVITLAAFLDWLISALPSSEQVQLLFRLFPHLGNHAKQVYVFQRTPSSIDVRGNRPTDPEWANSLKPGWQLERMENFDRIVNGSIEERDLVNDGWTDILHNLLARGKPSDDPAQAAAERQIADFEKMEQVRKRASDIVKDPATAEALKPWYNQLCKRPCFHDHYLQTFNKPNVKLMRHQG